MESTESEPSTTVPRFLDDLELVDRKRIRLDSQGVERWSLADKRDDHQVLADMGLAVLEGDLSPDEDNNLPDCSSVEDIENRSPNIRSSQLVKKSFQHVGNSPKSPFQQVNLQESSSKVHTNSKPAPSPKAEDRSGERKKRCCEDDKSTKKRKLSQGESLACPAGRPLQASPRTTCRPHPALHRTQHHQTDVRNQMAPEESGEKEAESEAGVEWGAGEELTAVDRAILEAGACPELEETLPLQHEGEDYFMAHHEGECFTAHDRSFCTSSEGTPPPTGPVCEEDGVFSSLSDEVILSILQWLPKKTIVRCMHVCRRWRQLGADKRLWAHVDLGGRVLPPGALPTLLQRHPIVLRLAAAQLMEPVFPEGAELAEARLQFLDMSVASVSPGCLAALLERCPALQRLSLEALTLDSRVTLAISRLKQLQALNLSGVTGLAGAEAGKRLVQVATPPRLEHLNLAWCGAPESALAALPSALPPGLLRLNLQGGRKTLRDHVVQQIVRRCPQLVELDISDAALVSGEALAALTALPSLEHLAISRCYMLNHRDYLLLEKCPSLQYVDVFGLVTPMTISILKCHLPKIQFNKFMHSSIARPTVGNRRTSIWGLRTRD